MTKKSDSGTGVLGGVPLGEGVRGRREKMADQVRHDGAAEARGRPPPTFCKNIVKSFGPRTKVARKKRV